MKKTMKTAAALAVLATPAFATGNLENPLYLPKAGGIYSKTGVGMMYKIADDSDAMKAKNHDGAVEFPIWRAAEELGYGITDYLTIRGKFGYTYDGDIDRKGMHEGRLGLNWRVFDGKTTDGIVWDVYADAFLGGVSKMKATLIMSPNTATLASYPLSFNYANYANGRYGAWLGTQVGKTWDKFTAAAFAEIERTFGNDNNEITIDSSARQVIAGMIANKFAGTALAAAGPAVGAAYANGLPATFNVDTKSTWEYSAGLKGFYEFNPAWSFGGGLTYKHRSANTIEGVNIDVDVDAALNAINPAIVASGNNSAALTKGVAQGFIGSLKDGWDEYILTAAVARKLSETVQVALYGEYTFDSADAKSQNGTDVKAELGVRLNAQF